MDLEPRGKRADVGTARRDPVVRPGSPRRPLQMRALRYGLPLAGLAWSWPRGGTVQR